MKKTIALILALILVLSLCACGNKEEAPQEAAQLEGTLTEIMANIYENAPASEIMLGEPMPIDLTDADALSYYTGLDSAENIEEAVFSEPMIGSIAYSVCLVRAKDGADIEGLKKNISENVDARKWICVTAEKVIVNNCGDVIILIMAENSTAKDIYNAFTKVADNNIGTAIERDGE